MKVADYILDFLAEHGVSHVFLITGGVIVPIVDAFHGREDIQYICVQHEQAAAMAADGYARFNGIGCAMATSGPGATNLITGIGCSYFDSIPVIFITGQVNTKESKGNSGVRQMGFQETDIVSIVKPITKYARYVKDARDIRYSLGAALWHALSGRQGPVLLDIPIDVQQAELPEDMPGFIPERASKTLTNNQVDAVVKELEQAKRPVLIYGAGCRDAKDELLSFIKRTSIPCLPSWAAIDLIPHDHPQFISQFGVYGARAGNFAVQNADLIIALGTRLDSRMKGSKFAPKAKKIIVDIDIHETKKIQGATVVISGVLDFLRKINERDLPLCEWGWMHRIQEWKKKYPIVAPKTEKIHPLEFMKASSALIPNHAIMVADCGANLSWVQQGIVIRDGQRLFSAYGYSPMGYSLPAAMGAHFATGQPIICFIGDGGIQINIQEFQTLSHYKIPIKVFVFNNSGYGIIRQFQDELCDGRYEATDEEHGVSNPDFQKVAIAYGLDSYRILSRTNIEWMFGAAMEKEGAVICDVEIEPESRIFPKCTYGNPLENQSPLLPPEELSGIMGG